MGSEWQSARLSDLYDISSGLSKPAKDFGSGYPFLAFKDVFNNYFVPSELTQLVQSSDKEQNKCSVRRGDVFLTRTSETMNELGMSSVALEDYERATFNGFTKRLRPKDGNELVPEYVGYFLRSQKFRNEMFAFSTMSTRASLNNEMISHLRISFPPTLEQEAIAWVLKTLDDKIELNRRMNATLEGMAQALFKSWFVDFDPVIDKAMAEGNPIPEPLHIRAETRRALGEKRKPLPAEIEQHFPSRFVFSEEMGWVPEGWDIVLTEEISSKIGMGPFGSNIKVSTFVESGVPIISGYHLNKTLLTDDNYRYITEEHAQKLKNSIVTHGDIIFTHAGNIGQVSLIPNSTVYPKYVISQRQFYLRPEPKTVFGSYLTYFFRSHVGQYQLLANASQVGVPSIARPSSHLKSIELVLPHFKLMQSFDNQCQSIFESSTSNGKQADTLVNLRDTLLPKLLSGQLRIPEAEKLMEEAL